MTSLATGGGSSVSVNTNADRSWYGAVVVLVVVSEAKQEADVLELGWSTGAHIFLCYNIPWLSCFDGRLVLAICIRRI